MHRIYDDVQKIQCNEIFIYLTQYTSIFSLQIMAHFPYGWIYHSKNEMSTFCLKSIEIKQELGVCAYHEQNERSISFSARTNHSIFIQ